MNTFLEFSDFFSCLFSIYRSVGKAQDFGFKALDSSLCSAGLVSFVILLFIFYSEVLISYRLCLVLWNGNDLKNFLMFFQIVSGDITLKNEWISE